MTDQHAIWAPSSAHRWIPCTASAEAIARIPNFDHLYGAGENEVGTEAHAEIERCLGLCDGETSLELAVPVNPAHPAAYGVALLLDFVRQLPPGRLWVERRVRLTGDIWGRCDVGHWDGVNSILTIVDYKNGYLDVSAEENEQLRIYGAAHAFTHQLPVKWIRYAVVQPNSFMPVPRVKQWMESADSLHKWASKVAAIPSGPKKFVAGEHCRYCPLFGQCPASRDILRDLSAMMANPPDKVPAHQVALFKACEKPISDWYKSLDKHALKQALASGPQPGMAIIQTQKHRAWKSVDDARSYIMSQKGWPALDPPTPAQAEKMGLDVSALCDRPEGGPALAFESDPRPRWTPKSAAKMFESVVDSQLRQGA